MNCVAALVLIGTIRPPIPLVIFLTLPRPAIATVPSAAVAIASGAQLGLRALTRMPADVLARYTTSEKWKVANEAILELNALLEVWLTVWLVIALLTPARSIATLVLHFTVLRFRYFSSKETRAACANFDASLSVLTNHTACPAVIRNAHAQARSFIRARLLRTDAEAAADIPRNRAAGGGGLTSQCAIM